MRLGSLLFFLFLGACGGGGSDGTAVPLAQLSDIQQKIFSPSCAAFSACHSPSGKAGKCLLTAGNSYNSLVNHVASGNPAKMLVTPGHTESSFLLEKLRGELGPDEGDPMPLNNPSLSDAQIQAIADWIAQGAPND